MLRRRKEPSEFGIESPRMKLYCLSPSRRRVEIACMSLEPLNRVDQTVRRLLAETGRRSAALQCPGGMTVSAAPPRPKAITGVPHACASTGTMPKSSSPGNSSARQRRK